MVEVDVSEAPSCAQFKFKYREPSSKIWDLGLGPRKSAAADSGALPRSPKAGRELWAIPCSLKPTPYCFRVVGLGFKF